MLAGVVQGGMISPVLSLYVNDMPLPSHHVELAFYAGDTAVVAKCRNPTLFVSYLESYLNELQRWLRSGELPLMFPRAPRTNSRVKDGAAFNTDQ
jgi:hypothetical protein